MHVNTLLSEIFKEQWALREQTAKAYEPTILKLVDTGELPTYAEKSAIAYRTNTSLTYDDDVAYAQAQEGSIAIIDIVGVMMRYGDWCFYGTEDFAEVLSIALNTPNISGVILNIDSPGGSTASLFPLEEVIKKATKPIVAFVNGMAMSAGYYIASLCNAIIANHTMAEVGSIGVMACLLDSREAEKKAGYKIITLIPKESSFKNRATHSALDGDETEMLEDLLAPWAIHFQNTVKEGRGDKLDLLVEGLLEGREFYASDAVKNGLIDDILDMEGVIAYTASLANTYNSLNQI